MRGLLPALAGVLVLGAAPPTVADDAKDIVFRFQDPAITESSALLDLGSRMVTVNDSGNAPVVYLVGGAGGTVGTTTLDVDAVDIEALAPADASHVWVGDIGDNRATRKHIAVYLAPIGGRLEVRPASYRLVYPDRPHDAESLVRGRDGRLYVITKSLTGGAVYRAPRRLDPRRDNELKRIASIDELATDAALMRDGRHVLVRGYGLAALYTFPGFRRLGSFRLPEQPQGEGISVGPGGRIRLSSEGVRSAVLQVSMPRQLLSATTPSPSPSPSPSPVVPESAPVAPAGPDRWWLVWPAGGAVLVAVGVAALVRRRRA